MYQYIKAEVTEILPTAVVMEVGGIGYHIIMANPYRLQSRLNEVIRLELQQIVREDAITLYGFLEVSEKELFQRLISVSGIGPKSAISILANDDTDGFIQAVESSDITYLTKFPGVGKKTAQQIILDLKGKFTLENTVSGPMEVTTQPEKSLFMLEAREALLGLGYSEKEVNKIWKSLELQQPQNTQEALSSAFKLLMK